MPGGTASPMVALTTARSHEEGGEPSMAKKKKAAKKKATKKKAAKKKGAKKR